MAYTVSDSVFPRKSGILHRGVALALLVGCAIGMSAQGTPSSQRRGKNSSGPRALGLVVFGEDATTAALGAATKKKGQLPRLIPVTLWYEQRFFDAEAYKASPMPMALETDIVYEVQQAGEPVGLFTVGSPARLNGIWLAEGRYTTNAELEARAKRSKPAPVATKPTDERPKLRRAGPGSSPSSESPGAGGPSAGKSAGGSGDTAKSSAKPEQSTTADSSHRDADAPPRLSRPPDSQAPPTPASTPAPPSASGAPAAATPTASTAATSGAPAKPQEPSPDSDPNRPTLHRGAVPQKIAPPIVAPNTPATSAASPTTAAPGASSAGFIGPQAAAPKAVAPKVMVAISDAAGPESRPYIFHWSPEEQGRLTTAALQIANDEIMKYGAAHYGLRPAPSPAATTAASRVRGRGPTPAKAAPPPPPLEDMQIHAFDLDYSNYPVIVLSGNRTIHDEKAVSGTLADRTYYVALVLWADMRMSGSAEQYRRLLVSVTDDQHLDQIPRLQLVDVVDADGDGIGDLLFRGTHSLADEADPSSWSFQLYRSGPDKLRKVYDSAGETE
jgi:hypothetical protein